MKRKQRSISDNEEEDPKVTSKTTKKQKKPEAKPSVNYSKPSKRYDEDEEDEDDDEDIDEIEEEGENEEEGEQEEGEKPVQRLRLKNTTVDKPLREYWRRPHFNASKFDPSQNSVIFQQVDGDYYTAPQKPGFPGATEGVVPVVRFYGTTAEGHSVCCHVRGYTPYFYIDLPRNFNEKKLPDLMNLISKNMLIRNKGKKPSAPFVVNAEIIESKSLMGYSPNKSQKFIKLYAGIPNHVKRMRDMLEQGLDLGEGVGYVKFQTYESNILFVLRCMIDAGIVGGNWIELPKGKYTLLTESEKQSHSQIEAEISCEDIVSHEPVGDWGKIAPLRILSFDIECQGKQGHFPSAETDPVITIGNYVTVQGENTPIIKNVFTLGTCANIVGADVHSFNDEKDMLLQWRNFVVTVDPDIIIGYNVVNFDIAYLINRATALKIPMFSQLGRIAAEKSKIQKKTFSSKAYGTRESKDANIHGRVQLDMLVVIQRDHKLSSYTLNNVSAHFLGEQKEEVHHSIIEKLQNGDEETRRRLATYCLKDAYLPQRLLEKLMIMFNYIEMARVTGIPLSFILSRGQQIKVVAQLLRKSRSKGFIVPTPQKTNKGEKSFAGAHVLDPKTAYYTHPITTLDFASLYPSIMIAHNLCYTTLVPKHMVDKTDPSILNKTPTGDHFVKRETQKGLLPEILEDLLRARKNAQNEMKVETDPMKKAVLNGRQLALKVSANSVYGFTGATVGQLPCLAISASVTAYGRDMIIFTKNLVEEHFTTKNGYKHDAVVVYGDTDSVMVKFGTSSLEEAMELGKIASKFISERFIQPIRLEFEKVYYPYLLIAKKRYAGLLWTKTEKHDKLDAKGIEVVRRDTCPLVRNVINTCLHLILIKNDVAGAENYCKTVISDLLMNRLDISMLVVSKSLVKKSEDYTAKQAHVELAKRMQKRDPATAPHIGDRVPYVIIKAAKGAKGYEKSEDPIWVLENNVPIDSRYYLEHYLHNPVVSIFEPIMGEAKAKALFSGEHTRHISVPTPKTGGILAFTTKKLTCMNCKHPLKDGQTVVCSDCKGKEPKIYMDLVSKRNHYDDIYSRVWTHCQRCQGSLHQDVLCTNRDCPVFYMRKMVQKSLSDTQETLDRFESIQW